MLLGYILQDFKNDLKYNMAFIVENVGEDLPNLMATFFVFNKHYSLYSIILFLNNSTRASFVSMLAANTFVINISFIV